MRGEFPQSVGWAAKPQHRHSWSHRSTVPHWSRHHSGGTLQHRLVGPVRLCDAQSVVRRIVIDHTQATAACGGLGGRGQVLLDRTLKDVA